jgi:hypothetical protein
MRESSFRREIRLFLGRATIDWRGPTITGTERPLHAFMITGWQVKVLAQPAFQVRINPAACHAHRYGQDFAAIHRAQKLVPGFQFPCTFLASS